MVNRDDTNTLRKNTNSNQRLLNPEPVPQRNSQKNENLINDDVIISLVNAYENERARQVSEWEQMRRFMRHAA